MKINNGGTAFPRTGFYGGDNGPAANDTEPQDGMSLRAWLAGTIASGCRAGRYVNAGTYPSETRLWSSDQIARLAISDADAIIKQLDGE